MYYQWLSLLEKPKKLYHGCILCLRSTQFHIHLVTLGHETESKVKK